MTLHMAFKTVHADSCTIRNVLAISLDVRSASNAGKVHACRSIDQVRMQAFSGLAEVAVRRDTCRPRHMHEVLVLIHNYSCIQTQDQPNRRSPLTYFRTVWRGSMSQATIAMSPRGPYCGRI